MASLFQILAYRKNRSEKPTGVSYLAHAKKVAVVFESDDNGVQETVKAMQDFFGSRGIELKAYVFCFREAVSVDGAVSIRARHLDIIGCIGPKSRRIDRNVDMFISMSTSDEWLPHYEAACSKAGFKVGRRQTKDKVFDFVLTSTEGKPLPDVFSAMADILTKFK